MSRYTKFRRAKNNSEPLPMFSANIAQWTVRGGRLAKHEMQATCFERMNARAQVTMAEFTKRRMNDRLASLMAPRVLQSRVMHRWMHLRVYCLKYGARRGSVKLGADVAGPRRKAYKNAIVREYMQRFGRKILREWHYYVLCSARNKRLARRVMRVLRCCTRAPTLRRTERLTSLSACRSGAPWQTKCAP